LDGDINAKDTIDGKGMFELRKADSAAEMDQRKERCDLQEQKVLQQQMLWSVHRKLGKSEEDKRKKNGTEKDETNRMCNMRFKEATTETPQGWKPQQQYERELGLSLSSLPHERACFERYLGDYWNEEPNIPRLATGIRNRTDRLKALGNSIVPQIAELLFRRIAEIDENI